MRHLLALSMALALGHQAMAAQLYYATAETGGNRRTISGTEVDDTSTRTYLQIDQNFEGRAMARNTDRLFFSTEAQIYSSNPDGSEVTQLLQDQGFLPPISHIAASDSLVVFNEGQFVLNTMNPDGSGFTQVFNANTHVTPDIRIHSFDVDWNTGYVYIGDGGDNNRIVRIDLNNPADPAVVVTNYGENVDIPDVQVDGGKLYAAVADLNDNATRVFQSDPDGSNSVETLTLAQMAVRHLEVDGTDLYLSAPNGPNNVGPGGIFRSDIDGSNFDLAIDGLGRDIQGITLAATVEPLTKNYLVDCFGNGLVTCGTLDEAQGVEFEYTPESVGGPAISEAVTDFNDLTPAQQASLNASNFVLATGGNTFDFRHLTINSPFEGLATIRWEYDESALLIPEEDLVLLHFDNGVWVALPTLSLDTVNNILTAQTPSFSEFVLGGGPFSGGIPEPSSGLLLVLGLVGLGRRVRAKRSAARGRTGPGGR